MTRWYYARGDRQAGPVSGQELKQLAQSGQLLPTDLIWKEGESERRPAATALGLFPETTTGHRLFGPTRSEPRPARGGRDSAQDIAPRAGASLVGVVGFLAAMLSIALGGGASFLYWTDRHRPLVMPTAMLGLVLGNLVLLSDWLRDRARFSVSVMGVTLSTVALFTTFLDSGGLTQATRDLRQAIADRKGTPKAGPDVATLKKADHSEAPQTPKDDQVTPAGSSAATAAPSVIVSVSAAVRSESMTKEELVAKIESLGNPCPRDDLFKLVGKPQRTETKPGQLAGLFWYWQCKDGMVEVVLLNPELGSGEERDASLAFISKINVQ